MQEQILSRRTVLLGLTDRIQQLAERDLELSSSAVGEMVASLRMRLIILMIFTLVTGVTLTGVALWRLLRLENESQARFQDVLRARGGTQEAFSRSAFSAGNRAPENIAGTSR
jgi:hypothetical protein